MDTNGGPDDKTAPREQPDDGRGSAPNATPPPEVQQQTPSNNSESGAVSEGRVLKNRYLLERKIGAGGMGFVFRARDLEEERIAREQKHDDSRQYLAIKILRPEASDYRGAVLEEVRRTRVLVHQNIVRAIDCQQDGELLFMTMEYLEGKTLDTLLDEDYAQGMPWELARSLVEGMGDGLAYAHKRGVIHCDFKPSNVFITSAFSAKILDFGIARAARGDRRSSETGTPVGITPRYASPEMMRAWQKNAMADYQPHCSDDVFALACVVFELLTGQHPFGDDVSDAELARQRQLVCSRVAGLSMRQNQVLARAMAFDREQRTQRVEEFVQALILDAPPDETGGSRFKWLVPAVAAVTVAVAATLLLNQSRQYIGNWNFKARPGSASVPPTTAASSGGNRESPDLISFLGIERGGVAPGSAQIEPDLRTLIQTAPRQVKLGSKNSEIQEAIVLCEKYSGDCALDRYADEQFREVALTPFELDSGLVTVALFRQFVEARSYRTGAEARGFAYRNTADTLTPVRNGSWRNAVTPESAPDGWPVVAVDFKDAQAYCSWKGKRLPTEDEWEYVARGPERQLFPWGNDINQAPPQSRGLPAAGTGPSEGIGGRYRDLSAVVWQWVNTDHVAQGTGNEVIEGKVLKGGSWHQRNLADNRAAVRRYAPSDVPDDATGFRCAKSTAAWPDVDLWVNRR